MFRRIFISLATLALASFASVVYVFYHYSSELPDTKQLSHYDPPIVTRLYSVDDLLLEEYAKEHRLFVPIDSIPRVILDAFIAAEDKNFYSHPGVDLMSIVRAVFQNVFRNPTKKHHLVGGSTITQQVVKNFLLSNERSLARKIKEAILSYRITHIYSKERILELYLNQIYLGNGSYGVASAALIYFNKALDELTLEEAAFLAAMPKAPSSYNPKKNYERAKARRDWVIERMLEEHYITKAQAESAARSPIVLKYMSDKETLKAEFFAESVRRVLSAEYGETALYEGGLFVKTTLDSEIQKAAEDALHSGLVNYDRRHGYRGPIARNKSTTNWANQLAAYHNLPILPKWQLAMVLLTEDKQVMIGLEDGSKGLITLKELAWTRHNLKSAQDVLKIGDVIAVVKINNETGKKGPPQYGLNQIPEVNGGIVVMDHRSGRVLAAVGGYSFNAAQYNRVDQAKRQPGSTIKPFIYLAALENGFTPSTLIEDSPIEIYQGPGLPMWQPKNYDGEFWGLTTLRVGLEKSRNVMTARLGQMLGIEKIMEVIKRFGINDNPAPNLSLTLGSSETTLLSMTNAYGMLANGGKLIQPAMIEQIQDRTGRLLYKFDDRKCDNCIIKNNMYTGSVNVPHVSPKEEQRLTDPKSAYQIISMMQGVITRGTAQSAKKLNMNLGGKTGTTSKNIDNWFVGFNPDIVVGVYVGFDNPKPLGEKETGASSALPVFISFMEKVAPQLIDRPFTIPEGLSFVKIDSSSGTIADPDTQNGYDFVESYKMGTEPTGNGVEHQGIEEVDYVESHTPSDVRVIYNDEYE